VLTTASFPVSTTVNTANLSTATIKSILTGSASISRIAGNNDVTQLLLIVFLGVILPIVVVITTAVTWSACLRRENQLRHASNKRQTSTSMMSATLPIVAANLTETVDNRLNEVHSKSRMKSVYDVNCDATASVQCCASPVTLTIVNAVASDVLGKGKTGTVKSVLSASYSRIRRNVEGGQRDCSDKILDDHEATSNLKLGADLDRSFKNARQAATRSGGDVTCRQISRDGIASGIGPSHVSGDVNIMRRTDCGSCRGHDDVTFASHVTRGELYGTPPKEVDRYSPITRWSAASRDTIMSSPNDVNTITRAR